MSLIPAALFDRAPSPEVARDLWDKAEAMPAAFRGKLLEKFEQKAKGGNAPALEYLAGALADMGGAALDMSASDAEICTFASDRANDVRSMLMSMPAMSSESVRAVLVGFCVEFGAVLPPANKVTLRGIIGRMVEAKWWRQQVRRKVASQVEAHAIELGFVHRRAALYASDEAVKRHGEQRQRNRRALEATVAFRYDETEKDRAGNPKMHEFTLAELSEKGVSNPVIRRGELMLRMAGFEAYAKENGHVGMFYTCTAPSRMHPRFAKSGTENPKYDGTVPKACAKYLSKTWGKARAWLHRRGINIYGFRVAEPHHDGTPHWHMLFFMLPAVVESVTACFRKYFCEVDAHELSSETARHARFNVKKIDWSRGSAAGYISKYIAKNIDGQKNDLNCIGAAFDDDEDGRQVEVAESASEAAPRVLAWSSVWGIRQFQQIGGPGVTVWRELRRIREQVQGDFFEVWNAASVQKDWKRFVALQGGADCKRKDRPVQLWSEAPKSYVDEHGEIRQPLTKYQEAKPKQIVGVCLNRPTVQPAHLRTKLHAWTIKKAAAKAAPKQPASERKAHWVEGAAWVRRGRGFRLSGAKRPWSPVNNCTAPTFEEVEPPAVRAGFENPAALIAAASKAAVLNRIVSRRKAGAFGQFPKLKPQMEGMKNG